METIEERAHKQAQEWADPAISLVVEQELIRFGKEQRKIDIESVCDYFRRYNEQCEIQEMVNISDFRKAMEQ